MRTQQIKNYLSTRLFAVCPNYLNSVISVLNNGVDKIETSNEVSPEHSYVVKDGIAIIEIDGAMIKKNDRFNAICGGFVPYDAISSYIDKANNDKAVHTILFKVDTVGGEVAGADEIGEKIFNSNKKTITWFNNIGASAGIWIFTASDEVYANKTTILGSIGVMSLYYDKEDDGKMTVVSKNAENKNCNLNGDCKDKIQQRIDSTEDIFFERLVRNTNFTKNELITYFNKGDVIGADEALEIGFISDVVSYDILIKHLVTKAVPTSTNRNKPANIFKKENDMGKISDEKATSAEYQNLLAEVDGYKATLINLQDEIKSSNTKVKALNEEIKELKAYKENAPKIIAKCSAMGVDNETMIKALDTGNEDKASSVILDFLGSDGATFVGANLGSGKTEEVIFRKVKGK